MSLIKNDYWILNAGVSGSVIITFFSINLSILDFKDALHDRLSKSR